jgi:hypothetical protein
LGTLIFEWEAGGLEAKLMLDGKILKHAGLLDFSHAKDAHEGAKYYA